MTKSMKIWALCLCATLAAANLGCQPSPTSKPGANRAPEKQDKPDNKDKSVKQPSPDLGE